ncbi:YdeI/OmpD-associated family protein [Sphingomonas sp. RS2018]
MTSRFPQGTVHEAAADIETAVRSSPDALAHWATLTPLGRNEYLCWIDDAKQAATRARRIERLCADLLAGKARPCCWAGCIHRTDKAPGRWQQAVLIDAKGKRHS